MSEGSGAVSREDWQRFFEDMPTYLVLSAVWTAHEEVLTAQAAMREASRNRDRAVWAARATGVPAAELAAALKVNRHRIHAMLKAAETHKEQGTL